MTSSLMLGVAAALARHLSDSGLFDAVPEGIPDGQVMSMAELAIEAVAAELDEIVRIGDTPVARLNVAEEHRAQDWAHSSTKFVPREPWTGPAKAAREWLRTA